jgi:hypothetical protein
MLQQRREVGEERSKERETQPDLNRRHSFQLPPHQTPNPFETGWKLPGGE